MFFLFCQKYNIKVERNTNFLEGIIKHKTVIDYAVEYSSSNVVCGRINQVRHYKHILLPLELFRTEGMKKTSCATARKEKSPIK